ncbi:uncharacterized protein LOC100903789 [Galendromus occidentalis]|uniref:Uncharacterized protein LOC100903789 n=1 Tax=Galendromus occidentalis TaxID=34638 RepID=A0AAJ6QRT8_9ACAR|nr:uncharacterized protein LOC100903789 [Galendromus occidentalis]
MNIDYVKCIAKSAFASTGRRSMTLAEFAAEYRKCEGAEIPFRDFQYATLESFLTEAVGMKYNGGLLYCDSEDVEHVLALIQGQKSKPKVSSTPMNRNNYRPAYSSLSRNGHSSSSLGLNEPSTWSTSRSILSREELERHCRRIYLPPFRYELGMKLRQCSPGCSPEEFLEHFNRSNAAKNLKNLDLRGLTLMEFVNGLTDVFRVETVGGKTKLYPAITRSLSSSKLGNTTAPSGFASSKNQISSRSSIIPPAPMSLPVAANPLPSVNEVIPIFKRVNELFAGAEVSMADYLEKVGALGGAGVTAWLRAKRFNMDTFASFVEGKTTGHVIEKVPGGEAIRIRFNNAASSLPARDPPRIAPPSHAKLNDLSGVGFEPYSNSYRVERLSSDNISVDLSINNFDTDTMCVNFTLVDDLQRRLDLMSRMRHRMYERLSPPEIECGMACIAFQKADPPFCRAAIVRVKDLDKVEVFLVDLGMRLFYSSENLYRIPEELLEEKVYSYPGTFAYISAPDGSANLGLVALQSIKIELDSAIVKGRIVGFSEEERKYGLDLEGTALDLQNKGFISYKKPSLRVTNGDQSTSSQAQAQPRANGHTDSEDLSRVTISNKVLPNCETVMIVQRNGLSFILSSDVSRLLELEEDTFLRTLEENNIAVLGGWNPSRELLEKLSRSQDGVSTIDSEAVLMPLSAVAPLVRAYLWVTSTTLKNEKHLLRALTPASSSRALP